MSLHTNKYKRLVLFIWLMLILPIVSSNYSSAQNNAVANDTNKQVKKEVAPDEFSVLDEVPLPSRTTDKGVLQILEKARQKYLQALSLLGKKDTANAVRYFEGAINILNQLVSYPGIEENKDYTDLATSVIEDYEKNITNIDELDENSSLFIFRDKLFQEIDLSEKKKEPKIESLEFSKVDSSKLDNQKKEYQIPIDDNEYVQKSIEFLTKSRIGRKFVTNCVERLGKWGPMLRQIIEEENMPGEIIYLAMVESALNPRAVSRAKALGMWQFMRKTGENYGLNADNSPCIDERYDPYKSTRAAMRHLRDLYEDLGNWHLAMAAYNYGLGGVRRAIRLSNLENPDYWQLREYLPRETRNYIPLFIAVTKVVENPEKYGFDLSEFNIQDEFTYDTFTIDEPISLSALAKCANISVDELIQYNPELISSCTPPDKKEYELRIPENSKVVFAARLSALSDEEKQPWITYKVGRRETFSSIAQKYKISPQELASANNMEYTWRRLKRGIELRIPVDMHKNDEVKSQGEDVVKGQSCAVTGTALADSYIMHEVQKGETIYSIANKYSVRIADLRNLNNIPYDVEVLEPGHKIKIAPTHKPAQPNNLAAAITTRPVVVKHQVQPGETLSQIADDYNVSINDIKTWNRLDVMPIQGQYLKIVSNNVEKMGNAIDVNKTEVEKVKSEPRENTKKDYISTKLKKIKHKVRSGENLSGIAARYGVTETEVQRWNPEKIKGKTIYVGSRLTIYTEQDYKGSSRASEKSVKRAPKYYKVKRGDTLQRISSKFGVSVRTLIRKNKNLSNVNLKAGQTIRIQ